MQRRGTTFIAAILAMVLAGACGAPGSNGDAAASRFGRRASATTSTEPVSTTLPAAPATSATTAAPVTSSTAPEATTTTIRKTTTTTTRRPPTDDPCPTPERTTTVTGLPGDGGSYHAPSPVPLPVAGGTWKPIAPGSLGPRSEAVAVWTGTEMLVTGGLVMYQQATDSAAYDPATNRWRMLTARPEPDHVVRDGAWTGRELVVFSVPRDQLGATAPIAGAAYDPSADRWRSIAPPPAEVTGPDTSAIMAGWTGTRVVLYVLTRSDAKQAGGRAALYDPEADRWTVLPPIAVSLADGRAVVVDGTVAVLGICSGTDGPEPRVFRYDPTVQAWHTSPPAPVPVVGYPQVDPLWTGRELFIGSWNRDKPAAVYDPVTGQWRTVAAPGYSGRYQEPQPLPAGRVGLFVSDPGSSIGVYDHDRDAWAGTGQPPGIRPSGGNLVSTGPAVIWWGPAQRDGYPRFDEPSAAWLWTPD